MARTLPVEALMMAFNGDISLFRAKTNAASEEKGRIVAAKKAEKKSAASAICVC